MLLDQIPVLASDVTFPPPCFNYFQTDKKPQYHVSTMVSIGPEDMSRAIKRDNSFDTLLTPAVGDLHVRLYEPSQSPFIYPKPFNPDPSNTQDIPPSLSKVHNSLSFLQKSIHSVSSLFLSKEQKRRRTLEQERLNDFLVEELVPPKLPEYFSHAYNEQQIEKEATRNNNDSSHPQVTNPQLRNIAKEFPLFKSAKYTHTTLHPGELLYIPKGYWWYYRAVSYACAVSFAVSEEMPLQYPRYVKQSLVAEQQRKEFSKSLLQGMKIRSSSSDDIQ